MSLEQINITLGTAGHIDHGKTALVRCLTGCETDRLKAEKERGMSIDLGFAPCAIKDIQVGIVDVPGHENFIKTMVAGATGMDAVLLVVAADDGVMPQTREHLDILTLLGVRHGLVALTKIDRVDLETCELARADIREFLRGTFLEGAPILPVSSVTGEGLDAFLAGLVDLLESVQPKPVDGVFRLPLDRSFSIKGHGTVVSGIPVSGSAHIDDEVVLLPQAITGRIRGIQVYGRTSDTVQAGQCAALNIRHWDHQQIKRGDTLTVPGYFSPAIWFVGTLQILPSEGFVLKNGAQVKFHTGTVEVVASVYSMQLDHIAAGVEELVQIRTETPIVAGPGDRFIIRTQSPTHTVGGGMIIEAIQKKLKRNKPRVYQDLEERAQAVLQDERFVEYCIKTAPSLATSAADVAVRTKLPRIRVHDILNNLAEGGGIIQLTPKYYIHPSMATNIQYQILELVNAFHRQFPGSPGIALDRLRDDSRLEKIIFDGIVCQLKDQGELVERNGRLAVSGHQPTFREDELECAKTIETMFRKQAFRPPGSEEIVERTGATSESVQKILKILQEHEQLVLVPDGLLFHREAVDRARSIVVDFIQKEGRLESVKFKYLLDTTRKFALPLLDYFDQIGVTRRDGNTRYLKGE